jgi:hypothetical protein
MKPSANLILVSDKTQYVSNSIFHRLPHLPDTQSDATVCVCKDTMIHGLLDIFITESYSS